MVRRASVYEHPRHFGVCLEVLLHEGEIEAESGPDRQRVVSLDEQRARGDVARASRAV